MTTQADEPNTATAAELLSFRVAEQEYSVDIMKVREIRSWAQPTPLPHAPDYVCGVINLRGTVLPIIDLATRLALPRAETTERSVIVVLSHGDQMFGIVVDDVSDILEIPDEDMQPPPDLKADGTAVFIKALTIVEDRMIRVLELDSIVPSAEQVAA